MRHLSKIFFIHSAHIPYAEVMVDGNIHFTGTQGVGKSTLLRAILFFYNADPSKLGIRKQGQRSFDEFYLTYNNSYIIYEVSRDDDRPFSIIVSRQNRRAVFRFADAPFSKEWLIDSNGVVTGDPAEVRHRIQKTGANISNIITSYTDYRDIIYGNYHSKSRKNLDRLYLLRSSRYENLYRIIQNVFLNERIDSDFIKETIIQSMGNEGDVTVNLKFYRNQLTEFSEEYNDILLWTKKNRRGEIEVVTKANKVIEQLNIIQANQSYQKELCGQLNYAIRHGEELIPVLKKKIDNLDIQVEKLRSKLTELETRYDKEKSKIEQNIGQTQQDLNLARRYAKEYREKGIEAMINLDSQKDSFIIQQQQITRRIDTIERQAGDITGKYKILIANLHSNQREFETCQRQLIIDRKDKLIAALNALNARMNVDMEQVSTLFNDEVDTLSAQRKELVDQAHNIELKLTEIKSSHPLESEINNLKNNLSQLQDEERTLISKIDNLDLQCSEVTKTLEIEELKVEGEYHPAFQEIESKIKAIKVEIGSENDLLNRAKGSFCEWLDKNLEGWTDTIGKIADEKKVLYNSELSPVFSDMSGNNDSLFGVRIDLSQLPVNTRSPRDIEAHIEELDKTLTNLNSQLKKILTEKEEKLNKTRQQFKSQINSLNNEKTTLRGRLLLIPNKKDKATLDLESAVNRENEQIETQLTGLRKSKDDVTLKLSEIENAISKLHADKKARENQIKKDCRASERRIREEASQNIVRFEETIKSNRAQINLQVKQLEETRDENLKQEGLDVELLQHYRIELREVCIKLNEIDSNRDIITEYRIYKRDYIDRESDFKHRKKELEDKRDNLATQFQTKRDKTNSDLSELYFQRQGIENELRELEEGQTDAQQFITSETCPDFLHDIADIKTNDGCRQIIRNLYDTASKLKAASERLKSSVNLLRKSFSKAHNTFRFPTALDTDEEYLIYASAIRDFVEDDRIKEFQDISNSKYKNILAGLSREYTNLIEQESEIQKIINDVNYDFVHKSFAGVIRLIELRLDKSTSPVIQTLQEICDFWINNSLEIGETNLFSSEPDDISNRKAVDYLKRLDEILRDNSDLDEVRLTENFSLKLKVDENDNTTGWVDNMKMVGSDGTDILVKAIINILLINVFKQRIGKGANSFHLHCMMDEIGKLADENIRGILHFANERNIYIVNSAPKAHSPLSYRRLYLLSKDAEANTIIRPILSTRQAELKS